MLGKICEFASKNHDLVEKPTEKIESLRLCAFWGLDPHDFEAWEQTQDCKTTNNISYNFTNVACRTLEKVLNFQSMSSYFQTLAQKCIKGVLQLTCNLLVISSNHVTCNLVVIGLIRFQCPIDGFQIMTCLLMVQIPKRQVSTDLPHSTPEDAEKRLDNVVATSATTSSCI